MLTHIQIFTTGGTIDKVYFDAKSAFEVGTPQAGAVFEESNVGFAFTLTSLLRKDSLDLTEADRQLIQNAVSSSDSRTILITHGTDTMVETAVTLLELARVQEKVIVLTGAMAPARFQPSDAEFNLGCAVGALGCKPPGVYIAMSGQIFDADQVRKNRDLGRFESR